MTTAVDPSPARGPLGGVRIIEVAGIGAAPFCGMMLADMGAEVIRVERLDGTRSARPHDPLLRSRRSIALDLKQPDGLSILLRLTDTAQALFEAFRPGVAERLGFGPDTCLERNPRLVYGRLTGWGQTGPLARSAGHDINYIALSGALHAIGPAGGKPVPPLNLVGDFGGGGLLLAFGLVCALFEAQRSGRGQVVDAAMLDGALAQMAQAFGFQSAGRFDGRPGADLLSGAAPWYDSYETSDGRWMAVGAIEPRFFRILLDRLDLDAERYAPAGFQGPAGEPDTSMWPELRAALAGRFREHTRDHWTALFEGTDACVTPILSLQETAEHPHNRARSALLDSEGVMQAAPAPRFSRTAPDRPAAPAPAGRDTAALLAELGYDSHQINALRQAGTVA